MLSSGSVILLGLQLEKSLFLSCSITTAQIEFHNLDACLSWKGIEYHSLELWLMELFSVSSVPSLGCVQLFVTPGTAAHQASLSITSFWSLLKLMSIESVMPSNHLILLFPSPPAFNLSSIRVFSSESTLCMRWPKYWGFSFSISPSNEHPRLISFRMDGLDLLAVQGTLKSFLQHYSLKASILQHRGSRHRFL